jgi:hypothetical protein
MIEPILRDNSGGEPEIACKNIYYILLSFIWAHTYRLPPIPRPVKGGLVAPVVATRGIGWLSPAETPPTKRQVMFTEIIWTVTNADMPSDMHLLNLVDV